MAFIYELRDPVTGETRYIGLTTKTLAERLKRHMEDSVNSNLPVHKWFRKLARQGLVPAQYLVEEVPESEVKKAERFWIATFRHLGHRLLNMTEGGDGVFGYKFSPEKIRQIAEKNKGPHSRERVEARANSLRGKRRTGETLVRLQKSAAEARKSNNTPEQRKAQAERMKGNKLPKVRGDKHPRSRRVAVNGVEYATVTEAALALGVSQGTVSYWLKNGKAEYLV